MFENKSEKEIQKAILVCADLGEYDAEVSLDELKELARTAGAEAVARIIQKRSAYDSATCVGSGTLEQVKQSCEALEAELVIFDCELTGTQLRNIEELCECRIIDRTMLILDIFAQRAVTKEGSVQVELAQQKYLLPRLTGKGTQLSRLGGGIGTRGPGETKLEADKRHIRRRISTLERELEEMKKHRDFSRIRRKKDGIATVAIVGYTNAGKSTLLNTLTNAGVLAEDKLFATLDTVSRGLTLPDGRTAILTDTVGLISRLPHQLVEAFKSTLEEAANSSLIINLIDASSPECKNHTEVTEKLLSELGCDEIPKLNVFNKADLVPADELPEDCIMISAKHGTGLDKLLASCAAALEPSSLRMKLKLPYAQAGLTAKIRVDGKIFAEEYRDDCIFVDALVDKKIIPLAEQFTAE